MKTNLETIQRVLTEYAEMISSLPPQEDSVMRQAEACACIEQVSQMDAYIDASEQERAKLRACLGWFMGNAPEPFASKAESALAALTTKPSDDEVVYTQKDVEALIALALAGQQHVKGGNDVSSIRR